MRRRFRPLGRSDKPRVLSNRMSVSMSMSMSSGAHEPAFYGGLRTATLRLVTRDRIVPTRRRALWPLHHRRQRREDRFDIAAGAQPEDGAAVVEQVELDVTAAPHQLLLSLGLAPGRR